MQVYHFRKGRLLAVHRAASRKPAERKESLHREFALLHQEASAFVLPHSRPELPPTAKDERSGLPPKWTHPCSKGPSVQEVPYRKGGEPVMSDSIRVIWDPDNSASLICWHGLVLALPVPFRLLLQSIVFRAKFGAAVTSRKPAPSSQQPVTPRSSRQLDNFSYSGVPVFSKAGPLQPGHGPSHRRRERRRPCNKDLSVQNCRTDSSLLPGGGDV